MIFVYVQDKLCCKTNNPREKKGKFLFCFVFVYVCFFFHFVLFWFGLVYGFWFVFCFFVYILVCCWFWSSGQKTPDLFPSCWCCYQYVGITTFKEEDGNPGLVMSRTKIYFHSQPSPISLHLSAKKSRKQNFLICSSGEREGMGINRSYHICLILLSNKLILFYLM